MADSTAPANAYLTVVQAAQVMNCSPHTVRGMISRGEMRAMRFDRLIRNAVDEIAHVGKPVTSVRQSATPATPSPDQVALSGRLASESWAHWSKARTAAS